MCIIICKPAGVQMPDFQTICRCANNNPDGFGFALPKQRPFKSLSFDAFAQKLYECNEEDAVLIHFRRATHGSIKPANCHPFRDEDARLSFAHNGILNVRPSNDKTDSETAFRYILLPAILKFGFGSSRFNQTVQSIIGYSRFAFLTDDGKVKTYGEYIKHRGCLYSNQSFKW